MSSWRHPALAFLNGNALIFLNLGFSGLWLNGICAITSRAATKESSRAASCWFIDVYDQDTISESFYDKAGRVIRTKDANGVETFFEYDALGQQTAVIQSNVIDPNDSTIVIHDYLRTETAYDELGRRVLVRENISQGNPLEAASIEDSLARNTRYEYNSAGNLEAVILPAADDPDVADPNVLTHPRFEYTYDIYGNLKSIKGQHQAGRSTRCDDGSKRGSRDALHQRRRASAVDPHIA